MALEGKTGNKRLRSAENDFEMPTSRKRKKLKKLKKNKKYCRKEKGKATDFCPYCLIYPRFGGTDAPGYPLLLTPTDFW